MYRIELSVGWNIPMFFRDGYDFDRRLLRRWLISACISSGDFPTLLTVTLLGFYVSLYVPVFWKQRETA